MNTAELQAARHAERQRIEQHYVEQAHVRAARHGRSLTCQDKPVERHGTCIGLGADRGGQPINNGLGCLCPCHEPVVDA